MPVGVTELSVGVTELSGGVVLGDDIGLFDDGAEVATRDGSTDAAPAWDAPSGTRARTPSGGEPSREGLS
ncbi:hypothetical protein [Streptomyces cyaneus]|uniref:hypothetical protein n=1 Tax=Streptomyces cyaneus TaxID=1904 RepID=UPI000FF88B7B|nr:hypothetical protein [Streptomyces cyaneus]